MNSNSDDQRTITNLAVQFDIDCHRREIEEQGFLKNIIRGKPVRKQYWDNFDIFEVSEKLARALKKGGFSRVFEFLIDGEFIFVSSDHSKGKSIKEAIILFSGESEVRKRYRQFRYKAYAFQGKKGMDVSVEINRQHTEGEPVVAMKFIGELELKRAKMILNTINDGLQTKEMMVDPKVDH